MQNSYRSIDYRLNRFLQQQFINNNWNISIHGDRKNSLSSFENKQIKFDSGIPFQSFLLKKVNK